MCGGSKGEGTDGEAERLALWHLQEPGWRPLASPLCGWEDTAKPPPGAMGVFLVIPPPQPAASLSLFSFSSVLY